jgi:hypothetical protein
MNSSGVRHRIDDAEPAKIGGRETVRCLPMARGRPGAKREISASLRRGEFQQIYSGRPHLYNSAPLECDAWRGWEPTAVNGGASFEQRLLPD